jgi:hypothetical protein
MANDVRMKIEQFKYLRHPRPAEPMQPRQVRPVNTTSIDQPLPVLSLPQQHDDARLTKMPRTFDLLRSAEVYEQVTAYSPTTGVVAESNAQRS